MPRAAGTAAVTLQNLGNVAVWRRFARKPAPGPRKPAPGAGRRAFEPGPGVASRSKFWCALAGRLTPSRHFAELRRWHAVCTLVNAIGSNAWVALGERA